MGIQLFLDEAYRRKRAKHEADVRSIGGSFVPLVVSATGVWHGDSLKKLRELCRYSSSRAGISEEEGWK